MADKDEALAHFELQPTRHCLLVLGGSLGSARINRLIEENLEFFESRNVQVLWQCGSRYIDTYGKYDGETIRVKEFIHRMDYAYALADTIISRSGAGSVSELALTAKPVLFIPSPHVAEDHQAKNARSLVNREAAMMIREDELDQKFKQVFDQLLEDRELREKLGENIKTLALPDATSKIADEIGELIGNNER